MSDTVSAAVEQVSAPKMITPDTFAQVLPAHIGAEKFTRWALTLLRKPELAAVATTDAGRLSIMGALLDCATLGLEPGRTYHLVPFKNQVTGIIDYKGEIELIHRANPQAVVVVQLVRAKDKFAARGANVPPFHEPDDGDWFGDRGEVRGGYAYLGGPGEVCGSMVVLMSEADFAKHQAKAKTQGVWQEWPEAMRLKTLVHQLRKFVPWSAEVRDYR